GSHLGRPPDGSSLWRRRAIRLPPIHSQIKFHPRERPDVDVPASPSGYREAALDLVDQRDIHAIEGDAHRPAAIGCVASREANGRRTRSKASIGSPERESRHAPPWANARAASIERSP